MRPRRPRLVSADMRSDGQAWALEQLDEIARASNGAVEVTQILEPAEEGKTLEVSVSIDCRGFARKRRGVPLRLREAFCLSIAWNFPLSRPEVRFSHKEYGDFPHVQWGDLICLYQAPDVEWQPSQGMFAFMQRLNDWLKAGAAGELDPVGLPLHPPVTYAVSNFAVIPRENAPKFGGSYWGGYALIDHENDVVAELGRWIETGEEVPDGRLATAILLPGTMPHEYPASMKDLMLALIERGVPLAIIQIIISLGVLRTGGGKPALFLLGAAMRGIAGGERLQHLACWRIQPEQAEKLREAALNAPADRVTDDDAFFAWALEAKVEWCRVLEDRPEIVERRDGESCAAWWRGRHVAILGCGAIGSAVAMMLARAGARRLQLYDYGLVTPGILVRQDFPRRHIGYTKSSSLKVSVRAADPKVEVSDHRMDVLSLLKDEERLKELFEADVIIDATASNAVASALEQHFRHGPKKHPPILSMCIGHNADFGMMTLAIEKAAGVALTLERKSRIALGNSLKGGAFQEEFWPKAPERRKLFQPEPGCSSPTFRGSLADVMGLSARMTNVAATWLSEKPDDQRQRFFGINLSGGGLATGPAREIAFSWEPDEQLRDHRHGYQILFSRDALASMLSWVRRSERTRGTRTETGGPLYGAVNEFLKVIWIDEISGPPADSVASPEGFLCGTSGVAQAHDEKKNRTGGSVGFVGMWHTHPMGLPLPSATDLKAMRALLGEGGSYLGRRFLMLIVGGTSSSPILSASVFQRSDYAS